MVDPANNTKKTSSILPSALSGIKNLFKGRTIRWEIKIPNPIKLIKTKNAATTTSKIQDLMAATSDKKKAEPARVEAATQLVALLDEINNPKSRKKPAHINSQASRVLESLAYHKPLEWEGISDNESGINKIELAKLLLSKNRIPQNIKTNFIQTLIRNNSISEQDRVALMYTAFQYGALDSAQVDKFMHFFPVETLKQVAYYDNDGCPEKIRDALSVKICNTQNARKEISLDTREDNVLKNNTDPTTKKKAFDELKRIFRSPDSPLIHKEAVGASLFKIAYDRSVDTDYRMDAMELLEQQNAIHNRDLRKIYFQIASDPKNSHENRQKAMQAIITNSHKNAPFMNSCLDAYVKDGTVSESDKRKIINHALTSNKINKQQANKLLKRVARAAEQNSSSSNESQTTSSPAPQVLQPSVTSVGSQNPLNASSPSTANARAAEELKTEIRGLINQANYDQEVGTCSSSSIGTHYINRLGDILLREGNERVLSAEDYLGFHNRFNGLQQQAVQEFLFNENSPASPEQKVNIAKTSLKHFGSAGNAGYEFMNKVLTRSQLDASRLEGLVNYAKDLNVITDQQQAELLQQIENSDENLR